MNEQLDLLSYQLSPEEVGCTEATPIAPLPAPNAHAIAYWEVGAAVYLRLMNNLMKGDRLPAHVKRHEISRLHELREQALAKVKELQ